MDFTLPLAIATFGLVAALVVALDIWLSRPVDEHKFDD